MYAKWSFSYSHQSAVLHPQNGEETADVSGSSLYRYRHDAPPPFPQHQPAQCPLIRLPSLASLPPRSLCFSFTLRPPAHVPARPSTRPRPSLSAQQVHLSYNFVHKVAKNVVHFGQVHLCQTHGARQYVVCAIFTVYTNMFVTGGRRRFQ